MIKTLKDFGRNKTFVDLNIVLIDTILSRGINFVLFLLIARTLGPERYGIYSLITVSILFLVSFFDFGIENIAVRFSGRYENKRENIFGIYLLCKTVIALILFVLLLLFPEILPQLINKPQAQKYLLIIFIGFVIENYRFILTTYYQSLEKFFVRALINVGTFLLRLIAIFSLLQLSVDNIKIISLFFAFSSLPAVVLFLRKFLHFFRIVITSKIDRSILEEILSYGKWIVLAALPIQLMTRLDFYLVTRFSTFEEMGLYNSAVQLVSFFSYIPFVFGTVFLPKASKYKDFTRMKQFVKKIVKMGIPITILVVGVIPFSEYLISFILGEKFIRSIPIFQILVFAFLCSLWNIMFGTVFYSLGKAKFMTFGAYIQLISFVSCAFILTPHFGIKGIAWSKVFANALYLWTVIYFLFKVIFPFLRKEFEDKKVNC